MDKVFKAERETIPTFSEKPLTCLEKFVHDTICERNPKRDG